MKKGNAVVTLIFILAAFAVFVLEAFIIQFLCGLLITSISLGYAAIVELIIDVFILFLWKRGKKF